METKTLRAPEGSLLRRERIESVLTEADQALARSESPSGAEEPSEERSFVGTGDPARAPKTQTEEVRPVSTDAQDGFVPDAPETIREQLRARTRSVFRTEVSQRLPEIEEARPARVTYRFNEPVTGARGEVVGRLLTFGPDGELMEFGQGQKVRRVVQVIEAEDIGEGLPTKEVTFTAGVGAAGIANWTKQGSE